MYGECGGQIYLCSKFESLDTSALLTDRVVLVGSSIQGTNTAIQFHGRGLEVDDKTGGKTDRERGRGRLAPGRRVAENKCVMLCDGVPSRGGES